MNNCEPGDLAIVVSSPIHPEFIGRIYRVIRLFGWQSDGRPAWVVEGNRRTNTGQEIIYVEDQLLRPIRPDPGPPLAVPEAGPDQAGQG
jgi:hypothetical protein